MNVEPYEYVIPKGVYPGKKVFVKLPSGMTVEIRIPPGYYTGTTLFLNPNSGAYLLDLGLRTNTINKPAKNGAAKTAPAQAEVTTVVAVPETAVEEPIRSAVAETKAESVASSVHEEEQAPNPVVKTEDNPAPKEYASPFADESDEDTTTDNLPPYESFFSFKAPPKPNMAELLSAKPAEVSEEEFPSSGRHKALLIGINYPDTAGASTINIAHMKEAKNLLEMKKFADSVESMTSLTDEDQDSSSYAKKDNIMKGLQWLAHNTSSGDTLIFGFHGLVSEVKEESYEDGIMPALLPIDYTENGVITDMDIWGTLIRAVPVGVKLVCVVAGNAGLGLSNKWNRETGVWESVKNPKFVGADVIVLACKATSKAFYESVGSLLQAKQGNPSILELVEDIDCELYSSQQFEPDQREFDLNGSVLPNKNSQLGQPTITKTDQAEPDSTTVAGGMLAAAGIIASDAAAAPAPTDAPDDDGNSSSSSDDSGDEA